MYIASCYNYYDLKCNDDKDTMKKKIVLNNIFFTINILNNKKYAFNFLSEQHKIQNKHSYYTIKNNIFYSCINI